LWVLGLSPASAVWTTRRRCSSSVKILF
jgi:hypothetical protein